MLMIDFLRHGELEGGIKYRGCLDESLTVHGRESMNKVWLNIEDDVALVMSSPLSRCAEPAKAWSKQTGIPCVIDERIQELNYGAWEGLTHQEIEDCTPQLLQQWRKDPTHLTPPKGESMHSFAERTKSFLDNLIDAHEDNHILVVAHSGSVRLMLAHLLRAPIQSTRHLAMPYACWSRVEVNHGQGQLVFHGRSVD